MTQQNTRTIVIFGSSKPAPESDNYLQAYELGKALARAGYQIANGGYSGTMAATACGASQAGANTIGVTCNAFGRGGPNQWIQKEIRTENLFERLSTLIDLAHAFVVLPGGTGTLLELALCWELTNKRFLSSIPIICLSNYWKPVIDVILESNENNASTIRLAESLDHVLQILKDHFDENSY